MVRWGLQVGFVGVGLLGSVLSAKAGEVVAGDVRLRFSGMIRPLWLVQRVDDPYRHKTQLFHFLRNARLGLGAEYKDLSLYAELTLTGREAEIPLSPATSPTWGLNPTLLDFYGDVPLPFARDVKVRIGQFKVPFGREQLLKYRDLPFAERSPVWLFFGMGRDVGGALHGTAAEMVDFIVAVQTGVGRDVPERYLPEVVEMLPLVVARLGIRDGWGTDPWFFSSPKWKGNMAWSLGAGLLYSKDALTGHSTVLNVRAKDKPLLLQANWNPYIARRPLEVGEFLSIGGDAGVSMTLSPLRLTVEGEAAWGRYKNAYGELSALGAWAAALVSVDNFTGGLRYAFLRPDTVMGQGLNQAVPQPIGDKPIQELLPMVAIKLLDGRFKLIAEVPVWIDAPVAIEKNVGAYVLLHQWDQITLIRTAGNEIQRQTIVGFRVAVQMGF
ncbi:MAG: OprO/OprP family phosphate-selective porin [Candidatus Kapabacteria bacterium]|nr:OprO/OprP family phosphate-selective porin [Candidatus Kapabacteria bacterium]MCS7169959.1 OprO/OprP family phosphate-selective porin [Candidatus Kapabacteria bacterium]MDW7997604.1 porin [Bacteroidota bacterium]